MPSSPSRLRAVLLALLCALATAPASAAAPPAGKPGASVGFRVLERTDASRASPTFPQGRPLQIAIWYPAASSTSPLTYRDYLLLSTRELTFAPAEPAMEREAIAEFSSPLFSAGVKPDEIESFLSTKMRASRDAAPLPGRFPLVLLAQGNGQSAHDQAFLAETLAAHGYVVATVPSQARIDGIMKGEQDIPAHATQQAADLAFALRALRAEPQVRAARKYGLVAHSFGARSALLLAMKDSDAAALVSLDGGIGDKVGKGQLEHTKGFNPAKATLPLLHLYEVEDRFMVPDHELIRSLGRANRWLVKVDGMRHVHFTSLGIAIRSLPALAARTSADQRTAAAWDAMAEATTSFLDTFLGEAAGTKASAGRWTPPTSPLLHPEKLPATGS
jgi:dienelactone hydrolase